MPWKPKSAAQLLREKHGSPSPHRPPPTDENKVRDTQRWRRLSKWVLAGEPLCRHCTAQGRETTAAHVDHIVDLADGGEPYDVANLQPLCASCHTRKTNATRAARGGYGPG
jgi:5-methylcytosine-specific restriction protein A